LIISLFNKPNEANNQFKGLWIYEADYAWEKHSVVRIDFSRKKAENKDDLKGFILHQLNNITGKYRILLFKIQK